jgi:hypothetical protein
VAGRAESEEKVKAVYLFTYLARLNKPKMVLFTPKLMLGWWFRGENYLNRLAIAVDRHPQVNKLIGP